MLIYPGVGFAVALALLGEWTAGIARPLFVPRLYHVRTRPYSFFEPLYTFLKLLGRQAGQGPVPATGRPAFRIPQSVQPGENALAAVGAVAPVLALCLLPLGGNPVTHNPGPAGDLLTIALLLAMQPITRAVIRLRAGGLAALQGTRDLGRLLAGLLPVLLLVAALAEVSGSHSIGMAGLLFAPETAQQTVVRLLAGVALLIALPWWVGGSREPSEQLSAGAYAARFIQTVALAAFWAALALPAPGELFWAVLVSITGTLFAYAALRIISERWAPARREAEASNLLWATTLPVAALALILALWVGA